MEMCSLSIVNYDKISLSSLIYCFIILKREVEDKLGSHFRVSDYLWIELSYSAFSYMSPEYYSHNVNSW
jgi:hypothetical protein